MIGIACFDHEKSLVEEFFELFKTPWEFCRAGRSYQAIISTGDLTEDISAELILLYSSHPLEFDRNAGLTHSPAPAKEFKLGKREFPIYGDIIKFSIGPESEREVESLHPSICRTSWKGITTVRIGYDLFHETMLLLTTGQPAGMAKIPTLELHIQLQRILLAGHGIPFAEIAPIPSGFNLVACLTHDVDFIRITDHILDRTLLGFIYRALFVSLKAAFRSAGGFRRLLNNWAAVLSLPAVSLGLARDFFNNIDKYLEIEKDKGSTFFLVPFKDKDGSRAPGMDSPSKRSVKYDIGDIGPEVAKILKAGGEIGLHGIEAWCSRAEAAIEKQRIASFSGAEETGIRMHWLYLDENSPGILAEAGFLYDSTVGYNDAVGFRCGTAQVFHIPRSGQLSELPLVIQDTALFYPDRMGLEEDEAGALVKRIIEEAALFGGVITVNWHQRSLGPERNWDGFYSSLLSMLEEKNSWFPRASDAVKWFAKRRQALIGSTEFSEDRVSVHYDVPEDASLPGIDIRVCKEMEGSLRELLDGELELSFSESAAAEGSGYLEIPL